MESLGTLWLEVPLTKVKVHVLRTKASRSKGNGEWNLAMKIKNWCVMEKEGNDPMVVSAAIAGFEVKKILFNSGSAVEDFTNHHVEVKRYITLPITLGDDEHTTTEYVRFFVVDHSMAYNAIFGQLIMRMARMMIATFCIKIKFPTRTGIGFMQSNQRIARQCHMLFVKQMRERIPKE
ncbi:hypothetical protein J1N35_018695 [Gossypium stocksii]|uniref:Uncharacterized protein n=1 Tax=Gossypium stocksii TaxID=47602 RepID=A0A9D3VR65_9ROSI|nr:hypothetical protein J1N35_018695 [Gossypium stocksii]